MRSTSRVATKERGEILGRLIAAGAVVLAIGIGAACGGSSANDLAASAADAGSTPDAATTGDGGGGGGYTLDNVCDRTGPLICELRKACCNAGPGYDEAGCLAHARAECEKDVAEARAGREQFHPERIDACLPKYRAAFSNCTVSFELLQDVVKQLAGCQLFVGQGTEGTPCTRSSECKEGTTPDDFVGCSDETHTCHTTKLVGEGKPCSIAEGLPQLCEKGLYCDVDLGGDAGLRDGKCKKATPLDGSCNKPLECGLGNYCSSTTKNCTAGKGSGAACGDGLECASVTCEKTPGAKTGTCAALDPLVKPEECKGP